MKISVAVLFAIALCFLSGAGFETALAQTVAVCPTFVRTLDYGARGTDVSQLQEYLASDQSIYPEGLITGNFYSATLAAVKRLQIAQGIAVEGEEGFGTVGPKTRLYIAQHCTSDSLRSVTESGGFGITAVYAPSTTPGCFANRCGECDASPVTGNRSCTNTPVSACYFGSVCALNSDLSCSWRPNDFMNICLIRTGNPLATTSVTYSGPPLQVGSTSSSTP